MDHRRQSNWYKAGMGRGIANGRGGNPFRGGESAQPVGAGAAQEFVASSPYAREEDRREAARLSGQRGGGTQTGMGNWKSAEAEAPAKFRLTREVESQGSHVTRTTLLRLVADNRFNVAHKSRAKLKLVSSN